jgi:aspartate/methionine/tyrosine aminotransferase
MSFEPFAIERLFARWEFSARHLFSSSDCETVTVADLLARAGWPADALGRLPLTYSDTQGDPALRERVAAAYPGLGADDVVICAPSEGIRVAAEALLLPGDRVVVQMPCYQALEEIPRQIGCTVVGWPLVETSTGWRMDLDRLATLLVPDTKLLILNAPHNPTGHLPTVAEMDAIVLMAERRGVRLFCDEMYRGLEWRDQDRLAPICLRADGAVSLGGLSKTYGLPGLRIGWLATRDRRALADMVARKDYTTICASAPSQLLACAALDCADALAARSRGFVAENLERATAFVARHPDRFVWRTPLAGSVAFARLVGGGAAAFSEKAVSEAGVMIVPSTVFNFGDDHLRVGLGRRGFADAVTALETWLAEATQLRS